MIIKTLPVLIIMLALASGCRTYEVPRTSEKRISTSKELLKQDLSFTELSDEYTGSVKTVILKPVIVNTYRYKGYIEVQQKTHFVEYNPLWELLEIPQGMFDLAVMPLVILAGACTGHYSEEFGKKGPWESTIRPVFYKLSPFSNDITTIWGRRKRVNEILKTSRKPTPPWKDTEEEVLSGSELVSVKPGKGNRKTISIQSSSQEQDGTLKITIEVHGMIPGVPTVTDCHIIVVIKTTEGEKVVTFTTEFNRFLEEFGD